MVCPIRGVEEVGGLWEGLDEEVGESDEQEEERNYENNDDGGWR